MKKFLLMACLGLFGCQTVTIRPDGSVKTERAPDFEQRQKFFAWGLTPEARFVNVDAVCKDGEVEQLQAQTTALDGFLGIITLGIYSPRTAKVWCKK